MLNMHSILYGLLRSRRDRVKHFFLNSHQIWICERNDTHVMLYCSHFTFKLLMNDIWQGIAYCGKSVWK